MAKIVSISAREILDSRGEPTLEVVVVTGGGRGTASVPAGASTGSHEAKELRDGDAARYGGRGVLKAVAGVGGEISAAFAGKEFDQHSLDEALVALDGTPQKERLGGNALLGVSLAFARACAAGAGVPLWRHIGSLAGRGSFSLPTPMANVLNGGKHTRNGLALQEFMIVPEDSAGLSDAMPVLRACIAALRAILLEKNLEVGLGDEGGFAPRVAGAEEALDLLMQCVERAGATGRMKLALDAAASSFYENGSYVPRAGQRLDRARMVGWYAELAARYPLLSIEDPFAEDDTEGFAALRAALPSAVKVVGDDLTVTNAARIAQAAAAHAADAVILKPNQAGTLTEALAAAAAAREAGWMLIASHRSGETNDDFIADFAVGAGAAFIKAGSLARGERVAKYNRLLAIAGELPH